MEFQEALMRLIIHKPLRKGVIVETQKESEKQKWKVLSFRRLSKQEIPIEFLCPISGSLMNDPVIVSSGHSFERACVQVSYTLSFTPTLIDGSTPDFSSVIPNLALKSAILNWCNKNSVEPPKALDFFSAEKLVLAKMDAQQEEKGLIQRIKQSPSMMFNQAATKLTLPPAHFSSSSEESVDTNVWNPPLQLTTPHSCSSASSSDKETLDLNPNPEEEELITKLKSPQVYEIEEAIISLRKITRTKEETRVELCTPRLLSVLRSLINSKYTNIQVNSVASWLISLWKKRTKLRCLALEDHNKTAIGVLGALPPLLQLVRSESEWTRHDSALALYHLSLVQSNKTRLVKLGAVPILLGLIKSGQMRSRVLLILGKDDSRDSGPSYE
ncbi:hypothetical protein GH714_041516 [Hevea brasiliensis]|uniref:RING-type E3 ubiquitin transferase n=1 Tax=Hevea brasiliensis TaxID=3981 RepID=A0A6A6MUC0_HEVBR|nr:hypothetical protein GH714_041516 [Hevea brasiliensis]